MRNDGHKFFTNTENAFYKELIASELKSRQTFNDCTATYRSRRNPILAERTPRAATFRRDGVPRPAAAATVAELAGAAHVSSWESGDAAQQQQQQQGMLATFGGVTGPIAEARMVSLEVARLHKQKEDLASRIREVERLIDYDKRRGTRSGN